MASPRVRRRSERIRARRRRGCPPQTLARGARRGRSIYAIIRATAINQDGHTVGMSVPSAAAQQTMIQEALLKAGIAARDVQYVEAHGTGTPIGDPIEARALGSVMSQGRGENEWCAIGSVKTNIGHLEAASGVAGLIKAALSLRHRRIPPSLHFHQPNRAIDFHAHRLRVVTKLETWPASDHPPIAGINSFARSHECPCCSPGAAARVPRRARRNRHPALAAPLRQDSESAERTGGRVRGASAEC